MCEINSFYIVKLLGTDSWSSSKEKKKLWDSCKVFMVCCNDPTLRLNLNFFFCYMPYINLYLKTFLPRTFLPMEYSKICNAEGHICFFFFLVSRFMFKFKKKLFLRIIIVKLMYVFEKLCNLLYFLFDCLEFEIQITQSFFITHDYFLYNIL